MIGRVFAFPSFPLTLVILLGALVIVVTVTAALEVHTPARHRRARSLPHGSPPPAVAVEPSQPAPEPEPQRPVAPAAVSSGLIADSAPVLVLGLGGSEGGVPLELGRIGIDAELAGVLFAAYVASGAPERSRVTGWVTAAGDPPSLGTVSAGERLRGKPAKVGGLLRCGDEDRNWVTLDGRTDIALAVDRRAPQDEVLAGLLHWWRLATCAAPGVSADDVGCMRRGISAVCAALGDHPFAHKLAEVTDLCATAEDAGVGMEMTMVSVGSLRSNDRALRGAEEGLPLTSAR